MVRIVASPRMASLTSLHLGGRALALATFESAADLETLPEAADRIGGRVAMLGGGTNILAADGELPVVLVRCGMDEAPAVIGEDGGLRLVRVGAGVKLPRLLVWCMKHGLSGFFQISFGINHGYFSFRILPVINPRIPAIHKFFPVQKHPALKWLHRRQ